MSMPLARLVAGLAAGLALAAQASPEALKRRASETVITSLHFLDVPYRRAGDSADDGFDCSGFTRHVFETSLGLVLPRRADEQANARGLSRVKRSDLAPGDLLFFNTRKRSYSHVGIYVGEGRFIHAPRPGAKVRIEDMRTTYWSKRYNGGRRAPWPADTPPETSEMAQASLGPGLVPGSVQGEATAQPSASPSSVEPTSVSASPEL